MDETGHGQAGDLHEYLTIIRGRKWTIILVTLLVIGSAIGFSNLQTPAYTGETRVLVEPLPTNQVTAADTPSLADSKRMRTRVGISIGVGR